MVNAALKRNQLGFIMQMIRSWGKAELEMGGAGRVQGPRSWRLGLHGGRVRVRE